MARSIRKALADTSMLVGQLGITAADVMAITVYGFGVSAYLNPAGFIRVSRLLRIPRSKIETSLDKEGNLHANFVARQTRWTTMIQAGSSEIEILTMGEQPKIERAKGRIGATPRLGSKPRDGKSRQLLLPGPS